MAFVNAEELSDLENALSAYVENKNEDTKENLTDCVENFTKEIHEHNKAIENTFTHIDAFRKKITDDAKIFNETKEKLPAIIANNDSRIISLRDDINSLGKELDQLTTDIRKKYLELRNLDDEIRKVGIVCAIPIINVFGAIAMAVLLGKKPYTKKEIEKLETKESETNQKFITLNTELHKRDRQVPILNSLCQQIPYLAILAEKSATTAQIIKTAWTDIDYNLGNMIKKLEIKGNGNQLYLKKLPNKIKKIRGGIKADIENYFKSKNLGVPVDKFAQKVFNLKARIGSQYYFSDAKTGLLYIPTEELYEITGKFV